MRARKLAEEHFYFKPYDQQEGWTFPDVEITKDTPANYCVEFNCQLPTSPARAAFVRLYAPLPINLSFILKPYQLVSHTEAACSYPMADPQGDGGIISSIADEIEKCAPVFFSGSTLSLQFTRYTTLNSHEGIIKCLSGLDKKPLMISVMQASIVLQICCRASSN